MEIRVPYGRSTVSAVVPDDLGVDVIELPDSPAAASPVAEVRRALAEPVGSFSWSTHEHVGSVAIAVNDKTRPVPHRHLLPPLIDRLEGLGIPDRAVTFHVAVGGHPPMDPDEFPAILPTEVLDRFRVVSHDSERDDLVLLGETSRGTPVWVNAGFVSADLRIVVGTIEPHQFVGFSGGVKTAAIGLAGLATINANHTLMAHPDSRIGTYATNPARQDVEAIGELIGIDLALNVILDRRREIVRAVAGDPVAVMEAGTRAARDVSQVAVRQQYPLVVSSPGGHPKDIDVYQSQKAVASAARIVRPGGTILLVAACPEGAGSRHYEEWVSGKTSRQEVLDAYRAEGFRIGPHKAFQLARDTERARLIVCSDMADEVARRLLLEPADDLQAAIDRELADVAPAERIAVLPHAASTIPYLDPAPAATTPAATRYGVIGTGMMGVEHIENIRALDGATVTAICDTNAASRAAGAAAAGGRVEVFDDHRALLAGGLCDAVVVATPNHTHIDVVPDVLATGLHVMIEKPLCTSVPDCERLLALATARGDAAVTWMAMEYRYMPAAAELIRLVHDGAVGTPRMVAIREHRFPFLVKVDDWNRFSENTGGTLVEKTCHFFDLMNLILGERPHRVMASGAQDVNHLDEVYDGRTPDVLDNAFVIVDYPSGARALLDLCMFAEASEDQEEMSVVGELGKVEAKLPSSIVRVGRRGEHWIGRVESHTACDPRIAHEGLHHGSSYIEHLRFAEAIRTGGPPDVTLEDGYWAVATGVAAHRSIELGRPVLLAEIMGTGEPEGKT